MLLIRPSDFKRVILRRDDRWNDPDWIIDNALETMKDRQCANRAKVVAAITTAHYCENVVSQERQGIAALQRARRAKVRDGSHEVAELIQIEIAIRKKILPKLTTSAKTARQRAEEMKQTLRDLEAQLHRVCSRAEAVKAILQMSESELAFNMIMAGLQQDGYFDLPPEVGRTEPPHSSKQLPD